MDNEIKITKKDNFLTAGIVISALIIGGAWIYSVGSKTTGNYRNEPAFEDQGLASAIEEIVLPPEGMVLPIHLGDLGKRMLDAGVIDREKLIALYSSRGGLSQEELALLEGRSNGNLRVTQANAGFLLNIFWALGLSTKNDILENGPMSDPRYGGADRFASTAGWTLSQGNAMNHYSQHDFMKLTPEQQLLVERVSKGVYRPCCNNPTHFPDCNHGMAMLGMLELMASQGAGEQEMYKAALLVNSFWFPENYLTIANYLKSQQRSWEAVSPAEILGSQYSSASGYQRVLAQMTSPQKSSGGSCGI